MGALDIAVKGLESEPAREAGKFATKLLEDSGLLDRAVRNWENVVPGLTHDLKSLGIHINEPNSLELAMANAHGESGVILTGSKGKGLPVEVYAPGEEWKAPWLSGPVDSIAVSSHRDRGVQEIVLKSRLGEVRLNVPEEVQAQLRSTLGVAAQSVSDLSRGLEGFGIDMGKNNNGYFKLQRVAGGASSEQVAELSALSGNRLSFSSSMMQALPRALRSDAFAQAGSIRLESSSGGVVDRIVLANDRAIFHSGEVVQITNDTLRREVEMAIRSSDTPRSFGTRTPFASMSMSYLDPNKPVFNFYRVGRPEPAARLATDSGLLSVHPEAVPADWLTRLQLEAETGKSAGY